MESGVKGPEFTIWVMFFYIYMKTALFWRVIMSEKSNVCQSCGMPLLKGEDFGTEEDGSTSSIYCSYCYQQGSFTDKNASFEGIAEHGAQIMSQMYGMPIEKARTFVIDHIKTLYRWSGRIAPSCQSCGMALFSDTDAGTEHDGTLSSLYCTYCYQNGEFTEPDLTHDTMIKKYAPILANQLEVPSDKAEEMVRVFTSGLSRWKN